MIIVLDTNILCRDFYAKGIHLSQLLKMKNIVIPEIVFDETLNKHKEYLRTAGKNIVESTEQYNRIALKEISITLEDDYELEDAQYEKFLIDLLRKNGNYPPHKYPEVPHKEVVRRAIARKRPFDSKGRNGYRDYLIWRSVLDIVEEASIMMPSETVHFISENTKDFADEKDKNKLHPDLLEEMEQLQVDVEMLVYWPSLNMFIEKVVKPELMKIDAEELLAQGSTNQKQFMNDVATYTREHLKESSVAGYDVFVPGEKPYIESIQDESLDIIDISSIEEEKVLVTVACQYYGVICSLLTKTEMMLLPKEYLEESMVEGSADDCAVVHTDVPLEVTVEAIYDMKKNSVDMIEITDICDSRYCPYCPYE